MSRQATPLQRQALWTIDKGHCDPANVAEHVGVAGGYGNHAEFIHRLLDRGWVTLAVTDDGYRAIGYGYCSACAEWVDPDGHPHDTWAER